MERTVLIYISTPIDCSLNNTQHAAMDVDALLNHPTQIESLLNPDDTSASKRQRVTSAIVRSPKSITRWPTIRSNGLRNELPILAKQNKLSSTRKLQKSRIVGLRHRKAEKLRCESLEDQVEQLRQVNERLRDLTVNCDVTATSAANTLRVSDCTAKIISSQYICGLSAVALLQIIALRRNLDLSELVLVCPKYCELEDTMSEMQGKLVELAQLRAIHESWASYETLNIF